jgi:hypothetical protein
MDVKKLAYFKVGADVIEEKCKGITFVFPCGLKNTEQMVGTLFCEDKDPLALRMRTLSGEIQKIKLPVDIYPSLGLITYRNANKIINSYA